jgi:hypothetical protein
VGAILGFVDEREISWSHGNAVITSVGTRIRLGRLQIGGGGKILGIWKVVLFFSGWHLVTDGGWVVGASV